MKPSEVAQMFGVSTRTVWRWATTGKLNAIRTLGGHHRFDPEDVRDVFRATGKIENRHG